MFRFSDPKLCWESMRDGSVHIISFHFKLFIQGENIQLIRKKLFTICPVKIEMRNTKEN